MADRVPRTPSRGRQQEWRPLLLPALAAALVVESAFPASARAQVSFEAARHIAVGANPQVVAVDDLNGDPLADLAVANAGSSSVSVLLGNGDGSFQLRQDVPVGGTNPTSVAVGDFNGDQVPDLVTTNRGTANVSVLLGNGDGSFQAPRLSPAGGTWPNAAAVANLDADLFLDLAVATFNDGTGTTFSVLLGNGGGTFQAPRLLTAQQSPLWVAAGDVDADGRTDLVTANFRTDIPNTVSVLLGNGDGSFQAARHFPAGEGPAAVIVGHSNGDVLPDLAVANYGPSSTPGTTLSVLLGTGGGGFAPAETYPVGNRPITSSIGDFDGDGFEDQAVANWADPSGATAQGTTVSVLLGNGDGTFGAAQEFTAGRGVVGTAVGDFNLDGKPDLAVANYSSDSVSILLNNTGASGTHTLGVGKSGTGGGTVTSSPAGISCGADCSESYPEGAVVTLTATPAGGSTFTGWSGACSGTGACTVTMTAARSVTATFTALPPPDTTPPTISAVTASGITSSTATVTWTTDEASDSQVEYGPTAAYGGSTALDPVGVTSHSRTLSGLGPSTLYHYRVKSRDAAGNLGVSADSTFTTAGTLSAPVLKWQYGGCFASWCQTGWYSSPAVADLDADGRQDVIWGSYDVVALNGADGSLKWRGPSANRVWPGIAVADLTGDGTQEVIVGRSSNQLTVYNRFGSVLWTRNPFASGEVRTLAVADLETDGRLEIIAGHAVWEAPELTVFEPDGTVRPGWPARHGGDAGYGHGLFNENVAVADMNGDGFKEVFGPASSHYVTALDRNGNQLPASPIYNSISPAGPKVWSQVGIHVDHSVDLRGYATCGVEHRPDFSESPPAVADVNGDGTPELIVVGSVYDCDTSTSLYHMPFILKLDRTRWSGNGFDWTAIPTPGPGGSPRSEDESVIETAEPNPAVADLDGDGFMEILHPSYDGKVHAYWLDKTEHGSWPFTVPTSGAPADDFRFAGEPVVVDLDNDGHAEVIFTSWPKKATGRVGNVHVLDYRGVEIYRVSLPPPSGDTWNGGLGAPTVANIDADPDMELVLGTVASGVVAYDLPGSANATVLWGTGRGSYGRTGGLP